MAYTIFVAPVIKFFDASSSEPCTSFALVFILNASLGSGYLQTRNPGKIRTTPDDEIAL